MIALAVQWVEFLTNYCEGDSVYFSHGSKYQDKHQ